MFLNADLHIHSPYARATSKSMSLDTIGKISNKKGIDVLGCGDCLHSKRIQEIKNITEVDEGTFSTEDLSFLLTTEVEDRNRVHHLLIFPSLSMVYNFKELAKGTNFELDGRPKMRYFGEEIAGFAKESDALIGPAHAFTPWTAMYAFHDTLESCYGQLASYISFLELGLSANSDYGDKIKELHRLTFLTNSDAHSAQSHRIAREFNRFDVQDKTFNEIKKAILREGGRKSILNVGLPPEEGKYNRSACIKCFTKYTAREARLRRWKCSCGGQIKKGVYDRVNEISNYKIPKHPEHRPEYIPLIPLSEIIQKVFNHSSPITQKVQEQWEKLIKAFGDEITVLLNTDISSISAISGIKISEAIKNFREGKIKIDAGGGGKYGVITIG